jgi:DNA polymerase III gamma/tau subunit
MGNASQVEATVELRAQMARHAQAFDPPELLRVIRVFNHAANEARSAWQPSLPLEMAFVEALQAPPETGESTPESRSAQSPAASAPATTAGRLPQAEAPSQPPATAKAPTQAEPVSPHDLQATQSLTEAWQHILGLVRKQNPTTYGVLNSCKSHYMRGDELVLNFASDVLKSKMEKPENLEVTRQALSQVLQRPVAIRCRVDTAQRDAVPPGVDNDGMVAAALRDLGGELVDFQ